MTFLSIDFALFFITVLVTLPMAKFHRSLYIATVSSIFYVFAGWQLLLIAIISSISDQYCSTKITAKKSPGLFLGLGITLNLTLLIGVKVNYLFFPDTLQTSSVVPIGISFYTLQSISYLIDVRKGKIKQSQSYVDYLSYILFFPQLIAGPIERAGSLMPQLRNFGISTNENVVLGIKIFAFGAYLKLVVANRMADPVLSVAQSTTFDITFALNGFLGFIYVYADFFAYTLMARGLAKILNINLQLNFDKPFSRKTLIGFWQSWHISLTKWMVDYFYIPVMLRVGNRRIYKVVFSIAAMVLVGFWHGITLNFVIFGLIHGAMMQGLPAIQKCLDGIGARWVQVNNRIGIMFTLIVSGNIFLSGTIEQFYALFDANSYELLNQANLAMLSAPSYLISLGFLAPLILHEFTRTDIFIRRTGLRGDLGIIASFLLVIALMHYSGKPHVYFQF